LLVTLLLVEQDPKWMIRTNRMAQVAQVEHSLGPGCEIN
jgi:hypothetical protein